MIFVALLAEGGDRNMFIPLSCGGNGPVALLAEGGDRNLDYFEVIAPFTKSPSSRRAGIEILTIAEQRPNTKRRPPRGGRG